MAFGQFDDVLPGHRRLSASSAAAPATALGMVSTSPARSAVVAPIGRINGNDEAVVGGDLHVPSGPTAPSASRIKRASGSLIETLVSPFLASSLACVLARWACCGTSSASFCCARSTRAPAPRPLAAPSSCAGVPARWGRCRVRSSVPRRVPPPPSRSSPSACASHRARPAQAGTLIRRSQLLEADQLLGDQPVTLWVSRRSNSAAGSRRTSPADRDRSALRRTASDKPDAAGTAGQSPAPSRSPPTRIKPHRQHHLRIRCRPPSPDVARLDPVVKLLDPDLRQTPIPAAPGGRPATGRSSRPSPSATARGPDR